MVDKFDLDEFEKRMLGKLRPPKPTLFKGLREAAKRIPRIPRLPRI